MTAILKIITAASLVHPEIEERVVSWGEESFPSEPRELRLGTLRLWPHPTPTYLAKWLPSTWTHSLAIDSKVVYAWLDGTLSQEDEAALRRLLALVTSSTGWAVLLETDSGSSTEIVQAAPGDVFNVLASRIKVREGLTLVVALAG